MPVHVLGKLKAIRQVPYVLPLDALRSWAVGGGSGQNGFRRTRGENDKLPAHSPANLGQNSLDSLLLVVTQRQHAFTSHMYGQCSHEPIHGPEHPLWNTRRQITVFVMNTSSCPTLAASRILSSS